MYLNLPGYRCFVCSECPFSIQLLQAKTITLEPDQRKSIFSVFKLLILLLFPQDRIDAQLSEVESYRDRATEAVQRGNDVLGDARDTLQTLQGERI